MKHESDLQGEEAGVTHATEVEIEYQSHKPFEPSLSWEENG